MKQSVHINNTYSNFLCLISGVSRDSILGALLCNIFLNKLFLFVTKASLHNDADDKAFSASSTNVGWLMELLSQKSNKPIDCLISNHMKLNPKKFQIIVITNRNLQNNPVILSINNMTI